MKEGIIIKNFGPIREVEILDIKPLTVFIGESGSGKSTIMKVVSLFRWIFKMTNIREYLKRSNIKQSGIVFDFKDLLKLNGLVSYLYEHTHITYIYGDYSITYENSKLNTLQTQNISTFSLLKVVYISDKRNLISEILNSDIKASSYSYYLKDTIENYIYATKFITEMDLSFLNVKFQIKKKNNISKHYIVGTGINKEQFEVVLSESSSGTQTTMPLSLISEFYSKRYDMINSMNKSMLNYLSNVDNIMDFKPVTNIGEFKNQVVHLLIEEPELSLYPESQRSLLNLLIKNSTMTEVVRGYKTTLMIATHSPYLINHINLLTLADEKKAKIEGASISFDDVSVYEVINGCLIDLKSDKTKLIKTHTLSSPIENIYSDYNKLK